jgi:ribose transport system ATP-binding protein
MRLQAIGVSKSYGPTRALRGVRLDVAEGEIHALLGENGAGKSTLLRILGGVERADSGHLLLDDASCAFDSPRQARLAGVFRISEERTLADDLTVEENLVLGLEPARRGWIDRRQSRELARSALAQLPGEPIPLDLPAGELTCGQAQQVEIARALLGDPKVLLLDEPTRSLSHWEIAPLFETLRELARRGVALLFISHFMEEAQALCSRYTMLRDGEAVAGGRLDEVDTDGLIRAMTGHELPAPVPRPRRCLGKPLLELKKISGSSSPRQIDLTLHEGEILGLAGLDGAGRSETLRAIFGLAKLREGELWRRGSRARRRTPPRALRAGIGLAVKDRREAIFPHLSLADNLTLSCLGRFGVLGFLSLERQSFAALDWMEKLHIRARGPWQRAGELSGGNQQKVVLARLLLHHATVLLLDEPTRGIDLPTKAQIHEILTELAHQGKGILLVSSDPAELLDWCDTIALMRQGRLKELRPASEWTQEAIIAAALGPP